MHDASKIPAMAFSSVASNFVAALLLSQFVTQTGYAAPQFLELEDLPDGIVNGGAFGVTEASRCYAVIDSAISGEGRRLMTKKVHLDLLNPLDENKSDDVQETIPMTA